MMARLSLIIGTLTAIVALVGGLQWIVGEFRAWHWRRKQTGKWLLVAGLCCVPSTVDAACTGSGTTRTCAAATSSADIHTAVNAVSDPGTVTLQNGNYTISSAINFPMTTSVSLVCESEGGCNLSQTNSATIGMNSTCDGTSTKLYRISGMDFTVGSAPVIDFNAYGAASGSCTLTQIRIDHNTFTGGTTGTRVLYFGSGDFQTNLYGVVDHNTVTASNSITWAEMFGESLIEGDSGARGTINNLFVEDNVITISGVNDNGNSCWDSTGNPALVFRFNTSTNCRWATHGNTSSGSRNIEFYGNAITMTADGTDHDSDNCWRSFMNQGSGVLTIFKNSFTCVGTPDSISIGISHYRSAGPVTAGYNNPPGQCEGTNARDGNRSPTATYRGYPCWHQPGRDVDDTLHPIYAWGNYSTADSSKIDVHLYTTAEGLGSWAAPVYLDEHLVNNRDAFNAVSANAQSSSSSPFDGTTGMGFGTLANRPSTCTVGPDSDTGEPDAGYGGVGYWATDQGSWNTANNTYGVQFSGADGVLYHCTATNSWATEYTPYTYPHPLVGGGAESGTMAFFLRSWPLVVETASIVGALYHWRGAVAGVLIFLLGCGVTGASMIAQTTQRTIQLVKQTSYTTAQKAAIVYLTLTKKDTDT